MYYEPCKALWYQGDIVSQLPIAVTDITSKVKTTVLFEKPVIVVSQTCDVQRRHFVQVCPVFDFDYLRTELIRDGKSVAGAESVIESVRNRKINYYFYLPEDNSVGLKEGYVDLNFVSTIQRTQLYTSNRLTGLSDHSRQVLAYMFSNLFLRPH